MRQRITTLGGLGTNPSVSVTMVVMVEPIITGRIVGIIHGSGKETAVCSCDGCDGTTNTTCRAMRYTKGFVVKISEQERVKVPINELMLDVERSGSDSVSDLINSPATDTVTDKVVDKGGQIVLPETTEWMGVEGSLHTRAVTPEPGQHIVNVIKWCKGYITSIGVDIKGMNLAPDDIEDRLSTVEEETLGAVGKDGIRPIQNLVTYSGKVSHGGLTLLDASPGRVGDTTSLTSTGHQFIIFSTGKGDPIGNPITPAIKMTGNARTVDSYDDNIDANIPTAMTEGMELSEAGDLLYERMLKYYSGKLITAEVLGDTEVAVMRLGYTVQEMTEGKARKGTDKLLCTLFWRGEP